MDIPIDAKVYCEDKTCGVSTYVVINPVLRKATHLVVRRSEFVPKEVLAPVEWIAEAGPDWIRLRCTKEQLDDAEPFIETELIVGKESHWDFDYPADKFMEFPYVTPDASFPIPLEHQRIAAAELAVRRGAVVEALDGKIGRVDEFLVDATGKNITHLVLKEGHLWGKKEIVVPVSEIDRFEEGAVCLKLNKKEVEALPAVPVRR